MVQWVSGHLGWLHVVSVLVPSLALLLVPLLAHVRPGMQQMAQKVGSLPPYGRTRVNSGLLALAWPTPARCRHLGNEAADGRSFSISSLPILHEKRKKKFFISKDSKHK